jgi:hypothetical protein
MLNNVPRMNMIYVHSKLLIVDDRYVIVGSGNINDRSLITLKLSWCLESWDEYSITMDGKPDYLCSEMIHSWRMCLWNEHLGSECVDDPIASYHIWQHLSQVNSKLVEPFVRIDPKQICEQIVSGLRSYVCFEDVKNSLADWIELENGKELLSDIIYESEDELKFSDGMIRFLRKKDVLPKAMDALLSLDTSVRLNAVSGHIFPFPITFKPEVKIDFAFAAAPGDLFI